MPELEERCFGQFIRAGKPIYVEGQILDNCCKCSYDPENNKKCPYYRPIKMLIINVKDKDETKS